MVGVTKNGKGGGRRSFLPAPLAPLVMSSPELSVVEGQGKGVWGRGGTRVWEAKGRPSPRPRQYHLSHDRNTEAGSATNWFRKAKGGALYPAAAICTQPMVCS